MKIYHLSQIGQFHTNHNEDFLIIEEIGTTKLLIAVMDGCSSGTDSHFASNLIGKSLRKIAKNQFYKEFTKKITVSNKELLKECLSELFSDLVLFQSKLDLKYDELLSTLLLAIVEIDKPSAEILAIGDGVVNIDGKLIEYEQDNKPDYIGYHLKSDFQSWYDSQSQKLSVDKFDDLSIATDGIWTFRRFDTVDPKKIEDEEVCNIFFNNKDGSDNENMLLKKLIKLEKDYQLKPTDDLTIVRLIV